MFCNSDVMLYNSDVIAAFFDPSHWPTRFGRVPTAASQSAVSCHVSAHEHTLASLLQTYQPTTSC